jgi:hypothetical protein
MDSSDAQTFAAITIAMFLSVEEENSVNRIVFTPCHATIRSLVHS